MTVIPKKTTAAVLDRDNHLCLINGPGCLRFATLADHRANRGSGGSKVLNDPVCLIAACVICNGLKEDADGDYRRRLIGRGLRVEKHTTNEKTVARCAEIPVFYPDGWHRLEGLTRVPVREADAIEYLVLIGARKEVTV